MQKAEAQRVHQPDAIFENMQVVKKYEEDELRRMMTVEEQQDCRRARIALTYVSEAEKAAAVAVFNQEQVCVYCLHYDLFNMFWNDNCLQRLI